MTNMNKKRLPQGTLSPIFSSEASALLTLVGEYIGPDFLGDDRFLDLISYGYATFTKSPIEGGHYFEKAIGEDETQAFQIPASRICRFKTGALVFCTASLFVIRSTDNRYDVLFDHAYYSDFHDNIRDQLANLSEELEAERRDIESVNIVTFSPEFEDLKKRDNCEQYLDTFTADATGYFRTPPRFSHVKYSQNESLEYDALFQIFPTANHGTEIHLFRQGAAYIF
jgi:hypothetical protein